MEVKPGYKRTDVGLIPQDWDVMLCRHNGRCPRGQGASREGD